MADAMERDRLPEALRIDMECAEDCVLAHCHRTQTHAVIIYRDDRGGEFRRLIGPRGSTEIPPGFDDGLILARLQTLAHATDEAKLAIDAVIATAEAQGERVVLIPPAADGG
jgi:hypothetical protein